MPQLSFRTLFLSAATFVVALQILPGGSPPAHAGCGDYVHVGKSESAAASRRANAPAQLLGSGESAPQPVPSPCHGPSCRQRPMTPAAPAPVSLTSGGEQKACLMESSANLVDSAEPVPIDAAIPAGESPAGRIERPPRHSS